MESIILFKRSISFFVLQKLMCRKMNEIQSEMMDFRKKFETRRNVKYNLTWNMQKWNKLFSLCDQSLSFLKINVSYNERNPFKKLLHVQWLAVLRNKIGNANGLKFAIFLLTEAIIVIIIKSNQPSMIQWKLLFNIVLWLFVKNITN